MSLVAWNIFHDARKRCYVFGVAPPGRNHELDLSVFLDRDLADARVTELIDRIQGNKKQPRVPDVAEDMTRAFIELYERAIQAYKDLINA